MKSADTKNTTPASKANTPFFEKGQSSFFSTESDRAADGKDNFFSAPPAIQKKSDPTTPTTPSATPKKAATTPTPATTATAPAPITAPAPTAAPASAAVTPAPAAPAPLAELPPELKEIRWESKLDAAKIQDILQDNSWLTEGDQRPIMNIIWKYATKPPLLSSHLSPFDYLIVAMQSQIFTVGTIVDQSTTVFDQLMRRMSGDNIALFKSWMHTFANYFKDEKANPEIKFEIKKEHIIQGLEMVGDVAAATAELAAAGLTGGASELAILATWLATTLPELFSSAKTIIGVIDTIRNLKRDDLKKLFSAGGMGNVLVQSLFGELQGLPIPGGAEEKEEKDEGGRGEKGFMKLLGTIKRVITSLVSAYRKLAGFVNSTLGTLDLTHKDWFNPFAMAYAGVVHTVDAVTEPGGAIDKATGALRDVTSNFFESVKGRLGAVVGEIKDRLQVITEPARLLKTIADKAVEWVLNFIITHPPSRLFKLLGKLVTSLSGKSIVELLREKVSFADDIIKKIADSGPVQKLISPLRAPVTGITNIVDSIAGKAGDFIGNMETRVLAFMNDGTAFLKELTGAKAAPASTPPETQASGEGDTLGAIKTGIHSRLMTIGDRLLLEKGKSLGGKALSWFTLKKEFTADGEPHQIFFKGAPPDPILMVASDEMAIVQLFQLKSAEISTLKGTEKTKKEKALANAKGIFDAINDLKKLMKKAKNENETAALQNQLNTRFGEMVPHLIILGVGHATGKDLPETKVTAAPNGTKAGKVTADPLTKKAGNTTGSRPTVDPDGWNHIMSITDYDKYYVRLHILSEKLHGPGSATWNLTPGRKTENSNMEGQAETPAHEIKQKNKVLWYESQVTSYRSEAGFTDFAEGINIKYGFKEKDKDGSWKRVSDAAYNETFAVSKPDPRGTRDAIPSINTMPGDYWASIQSADGPSREAFRQLVNARVRNRRNGYKNWKEFTNSEEFKTASLSSPNLKNWFSRLINEGKLRKI